MTRPLTLAMPAGAALLVALAGCFHSSNRPPAPVPPPRAAIAGYRDEEYVGNDVCADCHYDISKPFASTSHACSLRRLGAPGSAGVAPPTGYVMRSDFFIRAGGSGHAYEAMHLGGNSAGIGQPDTRPVPVDIAVGSGKTGVTYVSALGGDRLMILRYSWFPRERVWRPTPRKTAIPPDEPGEMLQGSGSLRCVECHVTYLPEQTFLPVDRFFGIGCEACHGPAGGHVNAMRKGDFRHLNTPRLGKLTASGITNLCGRCHETESNIKTTAVNGAFPVDTLHGHGHALERSACFRKGRLSCLTCHNPHVDAGSDLARYNAICLTCHGSNARVSCPVSPRDRCVTCHMPRHQEIPGSSIPVTITSHTIAVYTGDPRLDRPFVDNVTIH